MKYRDKSLEDIRQRINARKQVDEIIKDLFVYIETNHIVAFHSTLSQIENDYQLMKDYLKRGMKDPHLQQVYNGLMGRLYRLNADIQAEQLIKDVGSYNIAHNNAISFNDDYENIKTQLESFIQDVAMLSIDGEHNKTIKQQALYKEHHLYMTKLFNGILVSKQWNESQHLFMTELLLSPTIDSIDAQLIVSAISLACKEVFDDYKFATLIAVYQHAIDENIKQRALVGWALNFPEEEKLPPDNVSNNLHSLMNSEQVCQDLLELQIQIFYCLKADTDNDILQNDILPNIMKGGQHTNTRINIAELDEEMLQDILHTEASEKEMEVLEQNFLKMQQMQQAGSDIYFGGFSQMKRFSFFMTLSNWFVPFYIHHPELYHINHKLGDSKFMKVVLDNGPFCDSDKYSFALAMSSILDQMPANMRDMLQYGEGFGNVIPAEEKQKPAYIRRMILQDLYRFYRLYSGKSDFHNPFWLPNNAQQQLETYHESVFFFPKMLANNKILHTKIDRLGTYLYKNKHYNELMVVLNQVHQDNSPAFQRLLGIANYQLGNYEASLKAYCCVLHSHPNDKQALLGKADCEYHINRYADAIETYKKVLELDSSNISVQIKYALSLMNNEQVDESMNNLYRLNYEYPENLTIQRAMAWGYLMQQKPEKAEPIYNQLLHHPHTKPIDALHAGYCNWFLSNINNAVQLFVKFLSNEQETTNEKSKTTLLHHEFVQDEALLRLYSITDAEKSIVIDLVLGAL